jgi:hypothetical protein
MTDKSLKGDKLVLVGRCWLTKNHLHFFLGQFSFQTIICFVFVFSFSLFQRIQSGNIPIICQGSSGCCPIILVVHQKIPIWARQNFIWFPLNSFLFLSFFHRKISFYSIVFLSHLNHLPSFPHQSLPSDKITHFGVTITMDDYCWGGG